MAKIKVIKVPDGSNLLKHRCAWKDLTMTYVKKLSKSRYYVNAHIAIATLRSRGKREAANYYKALLSRDGSITHFSFNKEACEIVK